MSGECLAPLAGNRAWVYARRADLALTLQQPARALALAMRARCLAPTNPVANTAIEIVRRRVDSVLPRICIDSLSAAMERVEGWLTSAEATMLARCVAATPAGCDPAIVEFGSYCGRSTLVIALTISALGRPLRLTAIDPHVGYAFAGGRDTYRSLLETLHRHRVDSLVDVVRARSVDVPLASSVGMVFIDGLHDRASVAADFAHAAPHVAHGGLVVFHDYSQGFPGVVATVNELLASDEYELVGYADSLVALRT